MEIAELKNRTVAELQGYAEALDIPNCVGLRKQELIFRIHEGLAARDQTPVSEGVLDILPDGYGFLRSRSWSYLASPDDVYVSPAQIASCGLRRGDAVAGPVRPPRRGERYLALQTVQRINGFAPAATGSRPHFEKMRPWYPDRRLTLEVRGGDTSMRMMDLIAPVGMGQRGLIVSPPKAGKTTILRHIARAIAANHPGVELTVPRVEVDAYKIMAPGARTEGTVLGVSHHHAELADLRVSEGRFLDFLDSQRHAQVCVIGQGIRRDLFGVAPAFGQQLKINDVWFEVVGVLAESAAPGSFQGVDIGTVASEIYVPATTAIRKFDRAPLKAPLDEIIVRLARDASPQASAVAIRRLLERMHGGADDFEIIVPEALLARSQRTQRMFNIVMGCIAGISLLVGGIGIMNIMLATVLERTREIGVRRAVGARRAEIRSQFMIEAFVISVLGGLAGVAMGVIIARVVAASAGWETVVTLGSVALSTGVSMAAGLVSGIYPVIRASQLDPIDALRYE